MVPLSASTLLVATQLPSRDVNVTLATFPVAGTAPASKCSVQTLQLMWADLFLAALDGVYQIAQPRVQRRLEPHLVRGVHDGAVQIVDLTGGAAGEEPLQHAAALARAAARGEPDERMLESGRSCAGHEPAGVEADDFLELHSALLRDGDRLA